MNYPKYTTTDTLLNGINIEDKIKLDKIQYNYNIIKRLKGEKAASEYAEKKFNKLF